MTLPNQITTIRLPLHILTVALMLINTIQCTLLALTLYIINIGLDKADGIIARKRKLETDFGKFYDIAVDRTIQISVLLVINHLLNGQLLIPTLLIISRDFVLTGIRQFAAEKQIFLKGSIYGKTKATFEMIAIYLGFVALIFPQSLVIQSTTLSLYLAVFVGWYSIYLYIKNNYKVMHKHW